MNDGRTPAWRARALLDLGRAEAALHEAKKALGRDPEDTDVLLVAVDAALSLNSAELALKYASAASGLVPENAAAHAALARSFRACGQPVEATAAIRRARQLEPEDAYIAYAATLLIPTESATSAADALRVAPESRWAFLAQAFAAEQAKRYDDARRWLQRLVAEEPDNVEVLHWLARLDLRDRDYEPAIDRLLAGARLGDQKAGRSLRRLIASRLTTSVQCAPALGAAVGIFGGSAVTATMVDASPTRWAVPTGVALAVLAWLAGLLLAHRRIGRIARRLPGPARRQMVRPAVRIGMASAIAILALGAAVYAYGSPATLERATASLPRKTATTFVVATVPRVTAPQIPRPPGVTGRVPVPASPPPAISYPVPVTREVIDGNPIARWRQLEMFRLSGIACAPLGALTMVAYVRLKRRLGL